MKTIDITELDPSNFNWLRESKKSKEQPIQEEVEAETSARKNRRVSGGLPSVLQTADLEDAETWEPNGLPQCTFPQFGLWPKTQPCKDQSLRERVPH